MQTSSGFRSRTEVRRSVHVMSRRTVPVIPINLIAEELMSTKSVLLLATLVLSVGCAGKRETPQPLAAGSRGKVCVPTPEQVAQIAASPESAELLDVFRALLADAKQPLTPEQILAFTSDQDWEKYFDRATLEKYLPRLLKAYEKMHALCR
jgi:hypothetical protein